MDQGDCRQKSFVKMKTRSEEHTSELQSPCNLVCRLLLEKKSPATCQNPLLTLSTIKGALHWNDRDHVDETNFRHVQVQQCETIVATHILSVSHHQHARI